MTNGCSPHRRLALQCAEYLPDSAVHENNKKRFSVRRNKSLSMRRGLVESRPKLAFRKLRGVVVWRKGQQNIFPSKPSCCYLCRVPREFVFPGSLGSAGSSPDHLSSSPLLSCCNMACREGPLALAIKAGSKHTRPTRRLSHPLLQESLRPLAANLLSNSLLVLCLLLHASALLKDPLSSRHISLYKFNPR